MCDEGLTFYAEVLKGHFQPEECPECLIALGFVHRGGDGRLVPIPPGLAANSLLVPMEQSIESTQRVLAQARSAVHQVEEVYRSVGSSSGVRVIRGAAAINATLESVVNSCQEELLTAQPGGGRAQELLEDALPSDVAALRRGVRQRTIYQHTVRTHGPTLSYVEQVSAAGAEVRTLDEVFDRLIVCDRRIAFVPDPAEERRQFALAIEHPGLIRYLVGIFDHAWERAVPSTTPPARTARRSRQRDPPRGPPAHGQRLHGRDDRRAPRHEHPDRRHPHPQGVRDARQPQPRPARLPDREGRAAGRGRAGGRSGLTAPRAASTAAPGPRTTGPRTTGPRTSGPPRR